MKKVLIADIESHDTLPELPGLFVRAGYRVDVLCIRRSWLRRNRFVNRWIMAQGAGGIAAQLIELAESGTYDRIILGDDTLITIMNQAIAPNDQIALKILPISIMENRAMLGSKIGFARLCEQFHIQVPKTIICTPVDTPVAAQTIGYPVVIKQDHGFGGTGVVKCDNAESLRRATASLVQTESVIVQQYIAGVIVNTESLFSNGKLLAYAYSETVKNTTGEFGVSCTRAYYPNPELEPVIIKIGESFGFNGFVNMTLMRDDAGNHYLIESDPRPQAWVPMGKFAGVDFSAAVKNMTRHAAGETSPLNPLLQGEGERIIRPTLGTRENPVIIRHFSRDLMRCIIERNGKGVWDWVINRDNRWRFIPWYDPVVVFWMVGRIIKFWWKNVSLGNYKC